MSSMTASRRAAVLDARWLRRGAPWRRVGIIVLLIAALALSEAAVVPALGDPGARRAARAVQGLTGLVLGLLATGAHVAGRARPRLPDPPPIAEAPPWPVLDDPAARAFLRLVTRVESQAQEVDLLATRLEGAYRELETTTSRLKQLSFRDEVTGLYNRRFFSLRLEEEVSRYRRFSRPVSVVMVDVDRFKAVNDELGHPAGDEALRDIGRILVRHSRGFNVIARFGGDEFAVLLVETPKAGAQLYADRIRHVIAGHAFAHGVRVTASFGVSSLPEDDVRSPEELIRSADAALYAAKRGGRNRVVAYDAKVSEPTMEPLG
jgi:diguanylate cyclase (GGDEF)-like protein